MPGLPVCPDPTGLDAPEQLVSYLDYKECQSYWLTLLLKNSPDLV
jgi:hypothetical protein